MNKLSRTIIVLVMLMGCSQPISKSKTTKPFNLPKNVFINHVTFNNLAHYPFSINEEKIEKRVIQHLRREQMGVSLKVRELTINLISIEEQKIDKKSSLSIHDIMETAIMITTGISVDSSRIDSNQMKKTIFILNLTLKNEKSKLFIEVSDYSDINELKELFEEALIHKIEEIF